MANIKPVSDLRNYNTVLKECVGGSPVYLTKNGRGRYVILTMDEYERDQAEKAIFQRIAEAEMRVRNGEPTLTYEEIRAKLGL
jgi:Phd_YefM.